MAFIDSTVVNVALPAIQNSLGGTVVSLQWVVEGYALLLSALILLGGVLGDIFGRRRMFLMGAIVFATASMACGFSRNILELVMARVVQGFGAAFLVPGSLSIIGASFDEKKRGPAIGTWSGFTSITTAAGPVLGGWLIEHASWRWAFFLNAPLALAVIGISLWRVPESRAETKKSVDWIGALLVTAGLTGVTYAFIEFSSRGWKDGLLWGALLLGIMCLLVFVSFEAHASSPMVPLDLFRSSNFTGANLLTLFLYAALGIFFFLFPLDLIQVQHYSATATGAAALPLILLMFLLSRWSGGLVTRFGPQRPLVVGPMVAATGFLIFAFSPPGADYWKTFFPGFVVLGFGLALSVAPLTTVVMGSANLRLAGTASGINNAVARVAGLLAVAILGMLMVGFFSHTLNEHLTTLGFPAGALHAVEATEIRLAATPIPAGLDSVMTEKLRSSIDKAFVAGFRLIMLICAGLSVASAGIAWRMIGAQSQLHRVAMNADSH